MCVHVQYLKINVYIRMCSSTNSEIHVPLLYTYVCAYAYMYLCQHSGSIHMCVAGVRCENCNCFVVGNWVKAISVTLVDILQIELISKLMLASSLVVAIQSHL